MTERLIDTHTHLYDEAFDADRGAAVERAAAAGVDRMLLPAIDSRCHGAMFDLCDRYPANCFPMIGLHPTSVGRAEDNRRELSAVEAILRERPRGAVYGVGEVGLDFHWSREYAAEQEEVFRIQIELALKYGLPLAIHTRDAWERMGAILTDYSGAGLRGVMHAFAGTPDDCRTVRRAGDFVFGIGGTVTFKNSATAETLRTMSPHEIVLETDSPYLAPVPYRGRRNESSFLRIICDRAAEIMGVDSSLLARTTTRNALRIFSLPGQGTQPEKFD